MKKINNPILFESIIHTHHLQDCLSAPLADIAELYTFEKGEYLLQQNIYSDTLYFLISGRVEVFSFIGNDRTHCQQYFCNCEILGEADLLWGEPAISYVLTLDDCYCVGISLSHHKEALLNDTVFLNYIGKVLASRLKDKTTERNRLLKLETRLASYILSCQKDNQFEICLKETADLLDSSYRHLLRIMASFCQNGYLKKTGRGKYCIADPEALRKLIT